MSIYNPLFKTGAGSVPALPRQVVGREDALIDLKARLGISKDGQEPASLHNLTIIRGWPGVGKTTIAAKLAYDDAVTATFPDGTLWISLGREPNLFSELASWCDALGANDLRRNLDLNTTPDRLRALLSRKRMLLIVDDVWDAKDVLPFNIGGKNCALIITTRNNSVAEDFNAPGDIYRLDSLNERDGLELLRILAPTIVKNWPEPSLELVRALEGLPLALQVAGHLLQYEANRGFEVTDLITELKETTRLMREGAPSNCIADLARETTPTVAALLQKSIDHLDAKTRQCFAYLGPVSPKPATFDLGLMKYVWKMDDPKTIVCQLVDRGLLESAGPGRYQMHALLVMLANWLLEKGV